MKINLEDILKHLECGKTESFFQEKQTWEIAMKFFFPPPAFVFNMFCIALKAKDTSECTWVFPVYLSVIP